MNWISVKDRLPELDTEILAIFKDGSYGAFIFGTDYDSGEVNILCICHYYITDNKMEGMLYWMPYPQGPKE